MADYPRELRYSKEHEWVRPQEDGTAIIGITVFAQEQLGDVVYVDLPQPGTPLSQFGKLGEVESVKAVSDLFSPLTGEVLAVNEEVKDHPELINREPYDRGWLLHVKLAELGEIENLLTAEQYEEHLASEAQ